MRTHGTLSRWNDERGFGFIAPAQGSAEIFVHISAFPRDGTRPRINELISFETDMGKDGKLRAIRVLRPEHRREAPRQRPRQREERHSSGHLATGITLIIVAALGVLGYSKFNEARRRHAAERPEASLQSPASPFHCDGRTMCSQMTSCEEAVYFLQHCPGTQMDGNNDGEPCEQQWCN